MEISVNSYPCEAGDVKWIRIVNSKGAAVTLSSLGAGIVGVEVPDRDGNIENVCLGYADPADYLNDGPCMGKTAGRYANRIAHGHLQVGDRTYQLAINCGPHHLHGGPQGFQNKIWDTELLSNGVRFSLFSPDGDENYPANLNAIVEYRWSEDNELSISLEADTDAPTVVNLTNHAYWNLDGADSGSALSHLLEIKAQKWVETDDTLAPTGILADVADTPMDFTTPKSIETDLKKDFPALRYGKGYDNCWVIDRSVDSESLPAGADKWIETAMVEDAVVLSSLKSGRSLHIDTDQPGVQVYSGNWLSGSACNRSGKGYEDYDGIAIEAQGFPDAPNHPGFPSQYIDAQHPYQRTIVYRFLS